MIESIFLRYSTSLRDPLYDYIPCTDLELNIIDTITFQRLKRINQSTGAKFVYPGAEHSRFSHSLGVMHLAGKMAERLLVAKKLGKDFCAREKLYELCQKGISSFPEIKSLSDDMFEVARKVEIVRIAGLLHDLGHCGFSHTLETIFKKYQRTSHEDMTRKVLKENKELNNVFVKNAEATSLGIDSDDIIAVLDGKTKEDKYLCEIISGPIDVDKIDYLARDAFHTGTKEYGALDTVRLTESLETHGNALIPDSSAVETVIDFWQARFHMFSAVYYHRVARAMELIIQNMIEHFVKRYQEMKTKDRPKTILTNFIKINNVDDYLLLDDFSIISELGRLRREGYNFDLAFEFFDMYLGRKPLTCVNEDLLSPEDEKTWKMLTDRKKLQAVREDVSERSGVPLQFVFIDAPPEVDIKVNPVFGRYLKDIVVYDKKLKKTRPIGDFDPKTVDALSTLHGTIRIYTLDEYAARVKEAYDEYKEENLA